MPLKALLFVPELDVILKCEDLKVGRESRSCLYEDLLNVAAIVGDAPLGPWPDVKDGPVDHCRVKQRDLVADVLLELIQCRGPGIVHFTLEISPQEEVQWRKVWWPGWPPAPPPTLPADDPSLELSVKIGHICICTMRGRAVLLPPQSEKRIIIVTHWPMRDLYWDPLTNQRPALCTYPSRFPPLWARTSGRTWYWRRLW